MIHKNHWPGLAMDIINLDKIGGSGLRDEKISHLVSPSSAKHYLFRAHIHLLPGSSVNFKLFLVPRQFSNKLSELASTAPDERNWKGIGIAVLVIGAVISLIVTAVILLTPDEVGRVTKPRLRLDEVFNSAFSARNFNGSWISDYELLYQDGNESLVIHNVRDNIRTEILSYRVFNQFRARSYSLSNNRKYLAFATNTRKLYVHRNNIYYVSSVENAKMNIFTKITQSGKPGVIFNGVPDWLYEGHSAYDKISLQTAQNKTIRYIYKMHLRQHVGLSQFALNVSSVENAKINIFTKITQSGRPGVIFNGIPDWLYEDYEINSDQSCLLMNHKEILTGNEAVWWSPNGDRICYATFDDTKVKSISYPFYGKISDAEHPYPRLFSVKYPKVLGVVFFFNIFTVHLNFQPGTINPEVSLWVVDINSTSINPSVITPPSSIIDRDHYFTRASWINDDSLSVIWMRRSQNFSVVSTCKDSSRWSCFPTQEVKASGAIDGKNWVEMYENPIYSKDGSKYFLKLPVADGHAGDFQNVAKVITKDKHRTYVTHGKFDVTQLLAYSNELKTIYYISTLEGKSGQRHLFSVSEETFPHPRRPKCLTCDLGDECLYNNAIFSPDTKYYVLECLGPRVPYTALYKTDGNLKLMVMDSNDELYSSVNNRAMPQLLSYQVPLPDNYKAEVRLQLPPDYRSTDVIRYPLLVFVYGGPSSQIVSQKFEINWGSYLASQKSIIVASIDARGSGFKGDRMVNQLYRQLGGLEVEDQIAVTRYLTENIPFIDPDHVAMWGWSYGGYVTAMTLMSDSQNVFQCGISVAPVTSWLYYDSVYTERYMQTPEENKQGYENADVLLKASNLRDKKYFLIHGTADDNVHFQQSMLLAKALNRAGIMYRTQIYPDENHFLGGSKLHLYRSMENFLDYCFPEEFFRQEWFVLSPRINSRENNWGSVYYQADSRILLFSIMLLHIFPNELPIDISLYLSVVR
ncbi:Prolyl endopeptidase FAP [Nymphon striatum]|nr:Prolyl endopeptidase FAP [Nymphon striatum]